MNTVVNPTPPFQSTPSQSTPSPSTPMHGVIMHTAPLPAAPLPLTTWTPPDWADDVSTDGDLIEYSRTLGTVPRPSSSRDDDVTVMVVQGDEIQAGPDRMDVIRHPAAVLVGGVRISRADAVTLSRMIDAATTLISESAG